MVEWIAHSLDMQNNSLDRMREVRGSRPSLARIDSEDPL